MMKNPPHKRKRDWLILDDDKPSAFDLKDMMIQKAREIIYDAAAAHRVPVRKITGRSRQTELVKLREAVIKQIREKTNLSIPAIGRVMGGRDNSTIMHYLRKKKGN